MGGGCPAPTPPLTVCTPLWGPPNMEPPSPPSSGGTVPPPLFPTPKIVSLWPLTAPRNWDSHLGGSREPGGTCPCRGWCHRVTATPGARCGHWGWGSNMGTTRTWGGTVTMGGHPEGGTATNGEPARSHGEWGHPRHRAGDRKGQEGTGRDGPHRDALHCPPPRGLSESHHPQPPSSLDETLPIPPSSVSCSSTSGPSPVSPKAPRAPSRGAPAPAPPDQAHPIPAKLINSH